MPREPVLSQFRRIKERHSDPPHRADTPRATPRTSPVKTEQYNKYKRQGGNELADSLYKATPLKNMVNSLGRFSAEPASLAPSGTSLLRSPPSSWPPRNTSPARSPATLTMTMTDYDAAAAYMNWMTGPEYPSCLWGAYRVIQNLVSLFLFFSSSPFLCGGHVTHNFSSLPGLASYF